MQNCSLSLLCLLEFFRSRRGRFSLRSLLIWLLHVVVFVAYDNEMYLLKCMPHVQHDPFFISRPMILLLSDVVIKHLMTGPKGNSEFCFPETLNVPRGEAEGNIKVEGKQNSLFPEGPVIKCFVIPPNSK